MSTIIKFDIKELRKLASDKNSCVLENKITQNLALQPWCLGNLTESIKTLLDYKIGKFDKEYNGILLNYKNLQILHSVGTIKNDNADIHFKVQADYFIFRPYIGATLRGIVNKKSTTHLGILVHRIFNVVIPRPTEEPGNKWIGSSIQEGQEVVFQIVVMDLFGALPYIRGELDERWVKGGPEGDDEAAEPRIQIMNVPYVNFDKTKPSPQKQTGDGSTHLSTKTIKKTVKDTPSKRLKKNSGTTNHNRSKDSDDNVREKDKSKRHSRGENPDTKLREVTSHKQSKKQKKETQ